MNLRTIASGLLLLPLAALPVSAAPTNVAGDLLPRPQEIRTSDGQYDFDPAKLHVRFTAPSAEAATQLVAHLDDLLAELQLPRPSDQNRTSVAASQEKRWIMLVGPTFSAPGMPLWQPGPTRQESYELRVTPEGIIVQATDQPGLFYGLQTFIQLLNRMIARGEHGIPCLEIRDWPALSMRGYSEDYGRNQLPTPEDHKRSIRFLASCKMNTYLWFIEPDHFVYRFDPTIGQDYDRFTFGEIRELVAYAKRYHVEVIPTVELLGHTEMLLQHPKYRPLAEVEGGPDLCATCEDSFDLVRKLVDEIAPAFESKFFHCGLDESFAIGKGRSAQAVKERGLERVMADYYIRMNDLVKSHGKTMMMYADIVLAHPGIIDLLPKDIIMMFWQYDPRDRYEGLDKLAKAGFKTTALSTLWDWRSLYPAYSVAFGNILPLARQAVELGSLGHFVSSWGDPVRGVAGLNLSELNTYGVAYAAAVSWNPSAIPIAEFSPTFALQFYGSDSPDLAKALTLLAQCQGNQLSKAAEFFHADPAESIRVLAAIPDQASIAWWTELKQAADAAATALQSVRPARNADYLRSTALAARMSQFAADMAIELNAVAQELSKPEFDHQAHASRIEALADRHRTLWNDYRDAYLATNRPINLKYIERLWLAKHTELTDTAARIRAGTFKLSQ